MDRKVEETVESRLKDAHLEREASEAREAGLAAQLDSAKDALQSLQKLHDQTQSQLFDVRSEAEARKAAKQYELEGLMEELEKAQARVPRVWSGLTRG